MSTPKIHVANDQAFQICPEWVLMANISPQAIRLYLVLRKFGDNTTEESHWSRANIASAMRMKSTRSVDQYVQELVGIGALKVRPRFDGNRQTSNWYKVITADPKQYSARVAESCTPVVAEECTPEVAEFCAQSQNLKEPRTSKNSLPADAGANAYTPEFETFWKAYPRKKEKADAFKAWKTAMKRTTAETATAAVRAYARDVRGKEPEYIKLGATWLNKRCWEDYNVTTITRDNGQSVPEWSKAECDAILGGWDYWSCPKPPEGLSIPDEVAWKKQRVAEHLNERRQKAWEVMNRDAA